MTWKLMYQGAVLAASVPTLALAETLKKTLEKDYVSGCVFIEIDRSDRPDPMFYLLFDTTDFRPMNAHLFTEHKPAGFSLFHYPKQFRLLDADGNIYFYGIARENADFQPLDATKSHYGTTSVQYLVDGDWVEL